MAYSASAPLRVDSLRLSSAEEASDANAEAGWNLQYDQLSCGAYECLIEKIQLPDAVLIFERSNQRVHQHGRMNQAAYGMAMPVRMLGSSSFHAQAVSDNSLLLGGAEELDLCTAQVFELAGLVVNKTLLDSVWADMFAGAPPPFAERPYVMPVAASGGQAIRQAFQCALREVLQAAKAGVAIDPLRVRDALLEAWVTVLSQHEAIPDVRAADARRRVVLRTVAVLQEMIAVSDGAMPTLLEICRRVGASPRKLNYCFQDALGLSPKSYLRAYRLNQVRRELCSARSGGTKRGLIQEIAAKWGFWHFGQFSADYKKQFSELPSQTLRMH